ncbi:phage Gp37/Gp68 family protein [Bradyrhizobium sp. 174]|uniref:phage Gp37/Gp68 family protein n=1 Tax=Bradyrhizobium sp. 174 TaxID=2782645 RepID=UPI001FF8E23D|nr:phage Gp37/Gp68 family protein [Bradyrhizobium sp. 174]MCK1577875.1 phage Gp37/Gp68 family protein [Bradyrhizobium sp. 174]
MATASKIEWTGHTWNPLAGCSVLTPGCKRCYAMKMAARLAAMGKSLYAGLTEPSKAGPVWTGVLRQASQEVLLAPMRRKKPTTYFVNSMSDLFHENVPDEWIDQIFAVMALTPQHTYQVLTKRSARMRDYCEQRSRMSERHAGFWHAFQAFGGLYENLRLLPLPNVWLGVSTERQPEADERIPDLLQTPAAIRFISAEPLLGPINLRQIVREGIRQAFIDDALDGFVSNGHGGCYGPKLDWVIVGGESGTGARLMHPAWPRALRDQCRAAGVAYFFKQWGAFAPTEISIDEFCRPADAHVGEKVIQDDGSLGVLPPFGRDRLQVMRRMSKTAAGRLLDEVEHHQMPGATA